MDAGQRLRILHCLRAPVGGLFQPAVALGDQVRDGQVLGAILGLYGQPIAEVVAPYDGKISSLHTVGTAQPGAQLFTILEPTTPRHVPVV